MDFAIKILIWMKKYLNERNVQCWFKKGEYINMNVFDIILCAIGILLLLESFLAKTKDVPSTIIIKIIPFFCGAYCLIYACMNSGFIKIG